MNWKEKPLGRKARPRDVADAADAADDTDSMEGWAVFFDPPEKNVSQARCRHEGVYEGDMAGWAQHSYIM